ncbi:MAG TPA: AAA family ATPase [Candidatus Limnocylindrales bacterium]
MPRPVVVIALPREEYVPVSSELHEAGYETIRVERAEELEAVLAGRRDVGVAILDGETDFDTSLELYSLLHDEGRAIPALMVVSPRTLEKLTSGGSRTGIDDEYFARPYSAESLRWRVEAMLIRAQTVDDGSGAVLQGGPVEAGDWARRATVLVVFNPKGGVGKTTVALNLAATLQVRRGQRVLLVDADTVTGHVGSSLGLDQVRTVADAWDDEADGGPAETFAEMAADHGSGLKVVVLSASPLHTDILVPERVVDAIAASRRGFDFIVVDMHPDYGPLNKAIFERADRIIVPVTPDVPALRAAVQFRDVAAELGVRERLAMVVNRANSGVSVADMERTVGLPTLALVRSAGLLFVRAANEGRTVVERFPKERINEDFDALAERILAPQKTTPAARPALRGLFARPKEAVRV